MPTGRVPGSAIAIRSTSRSSSCWSASSATRQRAAADHGAVRPHRHRGHQPRRGRRDRGAGRGGGLPGLAADRRCRHRSATSVRSTDPDGNMIEFSYDQGVYANACRRSGVTARDAVLSRVTEVCVGYLEAFSTGDPTAVAAFVTDDFINEHTAALGSGCVGHRRVPPTTARVPGVDARAALRHRRCHRRRRPGVRRLHVATRRSTSARSRCAA